jgi:hypothetical protein
MYLTTFERWTVEMQGHRSVTVAWVFHSMKPKLVAHVGGAVQLGIVPILLDHESIVGKLFFGPMKPNLFANL